MRSLLDPDNPVLRLITKIAYSAWLNLLWLVCSLPVVTAGAATTALYCVTLRMGRGEDTHLARAFFRSFKGNFRQATVIWLILLALGAFLAVDGYVVYHLVYENAFWTVIGAILIAAAIGYLMVLLYIFPLLARYENTTRAMFKNALAMGMRYLFCTLLMAAIHFLMGYVIVNLFTPAIVFGMGTSAWLCSGLLAKVFPAEEA